MFLLQNKQNEAQSTPTPDQKAHWFVILEHRHNAAETTGYRFSKVAAVAQNELDAVDYIKQLVSKDLPVGYNDLDSFLQAQSARPGANDASMDMIFDGYDRQRREEDVQMRDYVGWGYTYVTKGGIERSLWYKPMRTE